MTTTHYPRRSRWRPRAAWRRLPCRRCQGLTLIELMVVVVIIVSLVAITLPMMKPALQGRQIREAGRQINALLGAAQARATARGRPVGVMFHRLPNNPGASFQMSIAEVPPPYAGDAINSRAFATGNNPWQAALTDSWAATTLVAPGDFIKFDYRGAQYVIQSITQTDKTIVTFSHRSAAPPALLPELNTNVTPPQPNPGVPFQILRKPQRTAAARLELPAPAVVDLGNSGVGAEGIGVPTFVNPTQPADPNNPTAENTITIMFSPSGRVDRVFLRGTSDVPLGPIYLLVGRVDQLGLVNLKDANNVWINIGHRSGHITTAPNNGGPQITSTADVAIARQFALRAQNMGGR